MGDPSPSVYKRYVTHVIHLEGEGAPVVDRARLSELGIERVRLYGRKIGGDGEDKGMYTYDGKALAQALGVILGKRDPREGKSRRNTLES